MRLINATEFCSWDMVLHAVCCLSLLWSESVHCPMTGEHAFWTLSSSADLRSTHYLSSPLENHLGNLLSRSPIIRIHDDWRHRNRNKELDFVDDGGPHVSTMLVLSTNVFGHSFQIVDKSVSLFAVTTAQSPQLKMQPESLVQQLLPNLAAGCCDSGGPPPLQPPRPRRQPQPQPCCDRPDGGLPRLADEHS
jgi:hypothetical protein